MAQEAEASCLTIFDDFGQFVLTARTLKRASVVAGLVRLNGCKPHHRATRRTFGRWIDWVLPGINSDARTDSPATCRYTVMVRPTTAKCPAGAVNWNQKRLPRGRQHLCR